MQCDRGVFRQRGQRGGGCPERAPGDDVLRSFPAGHKDRRVGIGHVWRGSTKGWNQDASACVVNRGPLKPPARNTTHL